MTLTSQALRRVSRSVAITESLERGTTVGGKKGWRIPQRQVVKFGSMAEAISPGETKTVNIWRNGSVTDPLETVEAAYDFLGVDGGENISQDIKVEVTWIADESKWRITGADCEPEATPAPPGHGNDINLTTESAGTTQGTAHQLSFKSNRIEVATGTDNAVKLPSSFDQEDYCHIRNDDASDSITVFPVSGGFINGQAVDTGETITAGSGKIYTQVQSNHWISS